MCAFFLVKHPIKLFLEVVGGRCNESIKTIFHTLLSLNFFLLQPVKQNVSSVIVCCSPLHGGISFLYCPCLYNNYNATTTGKIVKLVGEVVYFVLN